MPGEQVVVDDDDAGAKLPNASANTAIDAAKGEDGGGEEGRFAIVNVEEGEDVNRYKQTMKDNRWWKFEFKKNNFKSLSIGTLL